MKLVCVTLKVFPGHVYSDTKALLDYGFSNFQHTAIDVDGSQGIEKILDTASVTIPSGFELSSLKSDLEQVTGGNSTAILSYTYEDNPVGRIQVQVDKGASFEEAGSAGGRGSFRQRRGKSAAGRRGGHCPDTGDPAPLHCLVQEAEAQKAQGPAEAKAPMNGPADSPGAPFIPADRPEGYGAECRKYKGNLDLPGVSYYNFSVKKVIV